jgi:para-nitrobenzyl esterase
MSVPGYDAGALDAGSGHSAVEDGGLPTDASSDVGQDPDGSAASGPEVMLSLGRLAGRTAGRTRVFEGIPYAEPPVGARRFALPAAKAGWDGVRSAIATGPVCPQVDEAPYDARNAMPLEESEDCLTLNVYAPKTTPTAGAPVMVFVHGGGGNTGAGSIYDVQRLSEAGEVVVVTLNYRLGALAWVVHEGLDDELGTTSGNLGLRDQQLALRWVRDHIAAFGGDPNNVTLFGQSHGAACTCFHMFAKGSETLADRYILHSGGCVGAAVAPGTRQGMEQRTDALVQKVCAGRSDVVACLREQDAKQLATLGVHNLPIEDAQGVYVDGELIEDLPRTLLEAGDYHHAPVLLGSTLHESHFLASEHFGKPNDWPMATTTTALSVALAVMYPDDWLAILEFYGVPSDAEANEVMVRVMDDSWMRCAQRTLGLEAARHGDDVFAYSFDLLPAVHIQDLDYVFGSEQTYSQLFEGAPVPLVASLVEAMQGYWTRFARYGDPNGAGAPEWPKLTGASDQHLILDREIRTGQHHLKSECDFWSTTVAGSH